MHTEPYELVDPWGEVCGRAAQCRCCGDAATFEMGLSKELMRASNPHHWRCERHKDRNPCAVDGCSKTEAANGHLHGGDFWICAVHWKVVCPPRSRERRLYHAWHRKGKKYGWPDEMRAAYWRYFDRIVKKARAMCSGDIDKAAIDKMFGWDK